VNALPSVVLWDRAAAHFSVCFGATKAKPTMGKKKALPLWRIVLGIELAQKKCGTALQQLQSIDVVD
jgi:hypothetical protein